ncbi:MAG: hypothetical protein KDB27_04805 [Planctomycetales bacterium]|nr:hypothetical protein [Planctomycetales bacterium]
MNYSLYGPAFEMPAEPSGLLMCVEGIVLLGLFIWRAGLLKRRTIDSEQSSDAKTHLPPTPAYECCDYEKRFALAFPAISSLQQAS